MGFLNGLMGGIKGGLGAMAPQQNQAGPSQDLLAQLFPLIQQQMQQQQQLQHPGLLTNFMQHRQAMGAPNQLQNSIFKNQPQTMNSANQPMQAPVQAQPPNQNSMVGNSMQPQGGMLRNFGPMNNSSIRY